MPVAAEPSSFISVVDFRRRFRESAPEDDALILEELQAATTTIETMVNRRLAPFANHTYSDLLRGIDPNEYGGNTDIPVDIYASLGMSMAAALGSSDLVRHFWLDEFAPYYPELWTYSIQSVTLYLTYGNDIVVDPSTLEGPQKDTGHCRLRLGTFAPEGSTLEVVYSGGFTLGCPSSLRTAVCAQAMKSMLLFGQPMLKSGMDVNELDALIKENLVGWAR